MTTLQVRMLWEPVDPGVALRERFGLADGAELAALTARWLRSAWGRRQVEVTRALISDQNLLVWAIADAQGLVLKVCRDTAIFPRLDAIARLLHHAAARGLPVAPPVPTAAGANRLEVEGPIGPLSASLMPEIRGSWLDVHDEAAVRDAGRRLAEFHAVAAELHEPALGSRAEVPGLRDRVRGVLEKQAPDRLPVAIRRLRGLLEEAPDPDPDAPQLVHRDYRGANLLTRDSRVAGILDLDAVTVDHRVQDLAQAATMLATRFTDWGPTPPAVRARLLAGYEEVRGLGDVERAWYEVLELCIGVALTPSGPDPQGWSAAL